MTRDLTTNLMILLYIFVFDGKKWLGTVNELICFFFYSNEEQQFFFQHKIYKTNTKTVETFNFTRAT